MAQPAPGTASMVRLLCNVKLAEAQVAEVTVAGVVDSDAVMPVDWEVTGAGAAWVETRTAGEGEAEAQVAEVIVVASVVYSDATTPMNGGITGAAATWVETRRERESEAEAGESSPEVTVGGSGGESCPGRTTAAADATRARKPMYMI